MTGQRKGGARVERLNHVFSALSDPSRRTILARLARGEATVGDVSSPLDMAQPTVSKHLKVLERAGLIDRRIEGRTHWLRLRGSGLRTAADWLAFYRPFWEEGTDRLARLVAELEDEQGRDTRRKGR